MTELGLHLPNRAFVGDDWPRIRALGVRHYVDLYLDQHQWPLRWLAIREAQPDAQIHVRIGVWGMPGDPDAEARETVRLYDQYSAQVQTWRRRNEPNIEADGLTPHQWYDYLVAYGRTVKRQRPGLRNYVPAISPSIAFAEWLDATIAAARDGRYDGVDGHVYGDAAEVAGVLAAYRQRWSGPLLVTEHNFGAGRQYDLQRYADGLPAVLDVCAQYDADALCVFIWQWDQPDPVPPTTVDVRDTVVETALRTLAQRADTRPAPLYPPAATDDLPALYGPGFARALRDHRGLVGDPVGEQVDIATSQHAPPGTDAYRFSHLQTTRGTLLWRKSDNGMAFWATGGPIYEFTADGLRRT